jgi:hypothetical protein
MTAAGIGPGIQAATVQPEKTKLAKDDDDEASQDSKENTLEKISTLIGGTSTDSRDRFYNSVCAGYF